MDPRQNPLVEDAEIAGNSPIQDDEIIREFLIESNENLNRLDTEIVDLERNPTAERLASIFRTIHTIKGTCGFLGFQTLECITHHAENVLSQLRSGQRCLSRLPHPPAAGARKPGAGVRGAAARLTAPHLVAACRRVTPRIDQLFVVEDRNHLRAQWSCHPSEVRDSLVTNKDPGFLAFFSEVKNAS